MNAIMSHKNAMTEEQIATLQAEFERLTEGGLENYNAMKVIAQQNDLEIVRNDGDVVLLESKGGTYCNCWIDNVSAFGFDDQIETWNR